MGERVRYRMDKTFETLEEAFVLMCEITDHFKLPRLMAYESKDLYVSIGIGSPDVLGEAVIKLLPKDVTEAFGGLCIDRYGRYRDDHNSTSGTRKAAIQLMEKCQAPADVIKQTKKIKCGTWKSVTKSVEQLEDGKTSYKVEEVEDEDVVTMTWNADFDGLSVVFRVEVKDPDSGYNSRNSSSRPIWTVSFEADTEPVRARVFEFAKKAEFTTFEGTIS
jgi:hypothetical protein